MDDTTGLIQDAVDLLRDYMGESVAKLYQDFYKKQESKIVVASVSELFDEMFGSEKAAILLEGFVIKYGAKGIGL